MSKNTDEQSTSLLYEKTDGSVEAIRATILFALKELLGEPCQSPWALLDFPAHKNVGDSAIWQGTLVLIEKFLGRRPTYVNRTKRLPLLLKNYSPEGPIFFLGGGNFGDLWTGHWEHRVNVLKQFRDRQVIQLPQSICFRNLESKAIEETKRAIGDHPDFTLMVRDRTSFDFASAHFDCQLILCPDFAYGLGLLTSTSLPQFPISAIMRTDQEKLEGNFTGSGSMGNIPVSDWVHADKPPFSIRAIAKMANKIPLLVGPLTKPLEVSFRDWSQWNLNRGVKLLGSSDVVITDRLHGHILCDLMKKPHVVLDNCYGKNFGYIDTWPQSPFVKRASNMEDALLLSQKLAHDLQPNV